MRCRSNLYARTLYAISRFLSVFVIAAFFITCSVTLFTTVMTRTLGITLTNENVGLAAKLTLLNSLVLAIIITVLDLIRTHITVVRPTKRIIEAAKKMTEGDFSARIKTTHSISSGNFSEISSCINKLAEELSATETLRSDFIANVSHELKTPLSIISNYATMLSKETINDQERREYAKAISDTSLRLATLVTNILKLNKLENQQITPTPKPFDLGDAVGECLLAFEEAIEKKGLEVVTDIEDGITVKEDREMLSIVWSNLISNAIKFTERGGSIGVHVKCKNNYASVTILDTGIGVSPEVGKHIFEKFYQADTSRASEGNGLGLALVKRVIDITGCDISVESEPGHGTAFTVGMRVRSNESL